MNVRISRIQVSEASAQEDIALLSKGSKYIYIFGINLEHNNMCKGWKIILI